MNDEIEHRAVEVKYLVHRIVQHDGYHDVYQIVAHQDGRQQFLRISQQLPHALAAVRVLNIVNITGKQ